MEKYKEVIKNVVYGGLLAGFLTIIVFTTQSGFSEYKYRDLLEFFMNIIALIACVFFLKAIYKLLMIWNVLPTIIEKTKSIIQDRKKKKSREELLNLKKLYDAEIITKEEFDKKAKELKKYVL
jgi:replication fork clamp-binding protein CrfC